MEQIRTNGARLLTSVFLAMLMVLSSGVIAAFAGPGDFGGGNGAGPGGGAGGSGGNNNPGNSETPRGGSTPGSDWRNPGSGDGGSSGGGGGGQPCNGNCSYTSFTQTHSGAGGGCAARQGPGSQGGQNIGYTTRTTTVTILVFRPNSGGNLMDAIENLFSGNGGFNKFTAGTWTPINNNPIDGELGGGGNVGHWVELRQPPVTVTIACYYAESWDDVTLWCVDNTRVGIDKVAGPGSGRVDSRTKHTSFSGSQTLDNCRNSGQYVDLYVELDEFGRYTFEGETLGRHCTARYYRSANDLTGARPADAIVGCGGLVTFSSSSDRIQIDCVNGVSNDFRDPAEYTAQACLDRDLAQTHCSVGGDPLFNGAARNTEVEAFRNGRANTIKWDDVNIEGSNVVRQNVTDTVLHRKGTPWDSKSGSRSNRQVAYVDYVQGGNKKDALAGKIPAEVSDFEAGFYKASDGGKNARFQLQPEYTLDVTLRTEKAILNGYDPFGGIDYDTAPMEYDTVGDCMAPAINIDVLRSVNNG